MEKKIQELDFHLRTLDQALLTLEDILTEPFSLIVQDATIQRFEYTFELAWKLFRRVALIEGLEVGSPRQAIRAVFEIGLLQDIDTWFEMLEARNLTSHTYNAATAGQVFESARHLPPHLRPIMESIQSQYIPRSQA
jgi:nucleotidyltransferase substrate binding protein (TIGR01987 family)